MIDKDQPLDVCKIEVRNLAEQKVKYNNVSMNRALKSISKEAGIPFTTLKKWIYPNGSKTYNKNRKKKVVPHVVQVDSCTTKKSCTTEVVPRKNGGTTFDLTPPQVKVLKKILKQISIEELQDVVSKAAIISKDVGAEQSVAEIINLGLGVFFKKQEAEQK